MVKRTNLEVANIIEAFLEGTGDAWDWDDFCSRKIENRDPDAIRIKCINLSFIHPPLLGAGYWVRTVHNCARLHNAGRVESVFDERG